MTISRTFSRFTADPNAYGKNCLNTVYVPRFNAMRRSERIRNVTVYNETLMVITTPHHVSIDPCFAQLSS